MLTHRANARFEIRLECGTRIPPVGAVEMPSWVGCQMDRYVEEEGRVSGPYSEQAVVDLIRGGLGRWAKICEVGGNEWRLAADHPPFLAAMMDKVPRAAESDGQPLGAHRAAQPAAQRNAAQHPIPENTPQPPAPPPPVVHQSLGSRLAEATRIAAREAKSQTDAKSATEFRRTCNACGKVWHSLKSRERKLGAKATCSNCTACGGWAGMCGGDWSAGGMASQQERNADAVRSELDRLRACPNCGSTSYREEVVTHGT